VAFEDFLDVMKSETICQTYVKMMTFQSIEHRTFVEVVDKNALNRLDTKRFAIENISTLAFGHKDIPLYNA
jgi:hypothetical protein